MSAEYERKHRQNIRNFKIGGVVLAIAIPIAILIYNLDDILQARTDSRLVDSFQGQWQTLAGEASEIVKKYRNKQRDTAAEGSELAAASRSGKAVWIEVSSGEFHAKGIDPDFGRLSEEVRAETPAEVKTVVLVWHDKRQVGVYMGGGPSVPAYASRSRLYVVDLANKKYLGFKVFDWQPKRTMTTWESPEAERHPEKIREWFAGLPVVDTPAEPDPAAAPLVVVPETHEPKSRSRK